MNLPQWHNYFESHYDNLHQQRAKDNTPVFVFEHGLDSNKISELKQSVHEHLMTSTPDGRYWLPWVVYATEIGYEFDGHEYWYSFQEKTPNWLVFGNRPFIRDGFKKFVKSFGGFKPSGIWADHFNIICYPITHAILPRDLQRQLAKVLYDLRFHFNRSFLQSTEQLGNTILSRSEATTKRFQQFSQNTELTGFIAHELLSHDEKESGNMILPSTLKRIVEDLRLQRDAGSWLDEARDKARFATKDRASRTVRTEDEDDKSSSVKLEPRLLLRPTGEKNWDLYVDIPDLLPLARQSTEIHEFLTESRARINGSFYDKPLARGRLVSYGVVREKLKTLPDNKEQLLLFRREKPPALDKFFKEGFQLEATEKLLFKIHSDGIAYTFVSPGSRYLILSRNGISLNPLIFKQTISSENLHLYLIKIPKTVSNQEERFLTNLGLSVKLGVYVSPTGTAPAVWDEETYIEFLADESPCLTVELNHELQTLKIEFGDDRLELTNPDVGKPIFVNLPYLPIGSYGFFVSGKRQDQNDYEVLGSLEIGIREPRSQQSATTSQNALLLFTDPYKPTFEQFFAEKVSFDFWTPPNATVTIYLTLLNKHGDDIKLSPKKKLTTISLPSDSCKLNSNIFDSLQDNYIRRESEDAHSCLLEFDAGELGTVPINFEREFLPLKWYAKADKNQIFLRLSDYSDSDEKISVDRYDFLTPDQKIEVPYNENHDLGFPIPSSGGLFIAKTSQIKQGIVVFRQLEQSSFKSFTDLRQEDGFVPKFSKYARSRESLLKLLNLYIIWNTSASVGSVLRKIDVNVVSNGFLLEIVSLIDDDYSWRKAEINYCTGKNVDSFYLRKAVSSKPSLIEKLSKICPAPRVFSADEWVNNLVAALGDEVPEERTKVQKNSQISHIKVIKRAWFAEFALRLCSRPETLQTWADKRYELGLDKMLAHPTLVRAARYIVLTVNRRSSADYKSLPYKWEWE
jgi:hypothetical protein